MKFSRLRLTGFKSFVEPSEFLIERGLTGVVGPNGCGKSNLVEALRWVMGESSYKNMRASGMDDVIFSGSGTRPARNTAEVTLFLDNADRSAPAPFNEGDELQVSRRIEREAGSVYRINGREARAKDVQLLFADQSTGARSPSMVGQGRIGELIQAKPQARRALLEEAAGISGLHTRRHEAELRLRAAEQNLERLEDVVGELQGQIESLRRQARQAARFKNLSADIRRAEAILFHVRWTLAKGQEAEARAALATATSLVAERANQQMHAAKDQAVGVTKLPELRDAAAAAGATLQRLTIARTQLDEEARRLEQRRGELERRLAQLDADLAREARLASDDADVMTRLDAEAAELAADEEGSAAAATDGEAEVARAEQASAGSEATLARLTAERAEAVAAQSQIENALRVATERRDRIGRDFAAAERAVQEFAATLAGLPDPALRRTEVEQAIALAEAAETAATEAEAQTRKARAAEQAARPPVQEARAAVARIETEAKTLARILQASAAGGHAPVLDAISVARGYETALGAALGDDLDASLEATAPARWGSAGNAPEAGDPMLPAGVTPLAELVTAPPALARRLAQIGVTEDGAALQGQLKPGQRLVSKAGALWRWDGFSASADAPTAAAQRLAQKNRLAELEGEAKDAAASLAATEAALVAAETAVRAGNEREQAAREGWRTAQRAVDAARDALAKAEKAAGEAASRRAALD